MFIILRFEVELTLLSLFLYLFYYAGGEKDGLRVHAGHPDVGLVTHETGDGRWSAKSR